MFQCYKLKEISLWQEEKQLTLISVTPKMDNSSEQLEEQLEGMVEENIDDVNTKQNEHNRSKRTAITVPCIPGQQYNLEHEVN